MRKVSVGVSTSDWCERIWRMRSDQLDTAIACSVTITQRRGARCLKEATAGKKPPRDLTASVMSSAWTPLLKCRHVPEYSPSLAHITSNALHPRDLT